MARSPSQPVSTTGDRVRRGNGLLWESLMMGIGLTLAPTVSKARSGCSLGASWYPACWSPVWPS